MSAPAPGRLGWENWVRSALKAMLPAAVAVQRLSRGVANCVLLTFDDGPTPDVTLAVLERLARYRARAVFFVTGQSVEAGSHVLRAILDHGHVLGNHSHRHLDLLQLSYVECHRDLARCQQLVRAATGSRPYLFRPPFGRLSPRTLFVPRFLGLKPVLWSLDTEDWRCRTEEDAVRNAESLIAKVLPRDIVLLHDSNPSVVTILEIILPVITRRKLDLHRAVDCLR